MKKTVVALLLSLAGFSAFAQAPASAPANKEAPPAAAAQENDSSAAEELGRLIGGWMKRATDVLKDLGRGISEGFKSAPADSPPEPACTPEQARAGKCKPEPAGKESEPAPGPASQESSSLIVRLFKALF